MKILIVDDSEANRRLLRQMLVHFGYESVETDNGPTAIEIVKQQTIDLVLMDIMMPGMDGYEATKIIKQVIGDNHIPVIFVTALQGSEALRKSLECGGDDYISKPISIETLESKIRAHLRIRELTKLLLAKNIELDAHNQRLQYKHELISYYFDNAVKRSYLDNRCIHYNYSPVAAFNGDLMLSRRSPSGGLYLLLGDFTGHGLTAAMGTLPVALQFFELTEKGCCIGDIARTINSNLKNLLPEELFFAASIVEINYSGSQLEIWNGGMPESVIISSDGNTCQAISSQHMPLGILDDNEFEAATIISALEGGDRLLLYTDGITETKNAQHEEFGDQRLHALFIKSGDSLFEFIHQELTDFCNGTYQQDDMSIVEVLCDQLPDIDNAASEIFSREKKLPWHFSTTIDSDMILNTNPVSNIVDTLDAALSLVNHKGLIYTLLSEVYNNALNHSILGLENAKRTDDSDFLQYYEQREHALAELSDAYIKCSIEYIPDKDIGELRICLEDSGNHSSTLPSECKPDNPRMPDPESLHGRGLFLLSELCKEIKIDNQNNRIELVYILN